MQFLSEELKTKVEEVYLNLVEQVDLNKEEKLIKNTISYRNHLMKRNLSEKVEKALNLIDDMVIEIESTSKSYNKKVLLASFEYLTDQWDVIPDTAINGLNDDAYILEFANNKLTYLKERQKNARKLKLDSKTILSDLGYTVKHMVNESKKHSIFSSQERRFMMKMANYERKNIPIPSKEKIMFTILVERYLDKLGSNYNCNISACDDCYSIKKYFNYQIN